MNEKPDAEQYARIVLWHLCSLQAQINIMQSDIIRQSGRDAGATDMEILDQTSKLGKLVYKHAELLYRDALEQANIKPSPTYPHRPD